MLKLCTIFILQFPCFSSKFALYGKTVSCRSTDSKSLLVKGMSQKKSIHSNRESLDNIPEIHDRDFVTNLDGISIDPGIVREKLCDLNSSKATGPDELPPSPLPEC